MAEEWNVKEFLSGYKDFIGRLRQRLRGSRESFGVPYLIPQQLGTPTEFFDFTLRTSARHVTFRLRRDNLYLIGYQMENGQWLELGRDGDDTHLIEGANFLGFGGSYDNMARAAGRERPEGLQVTSNTLETAVSNLATKSDRALRAQGLIVVIMMICEAVRLNPIRDVVATGQSSIEGWMMDAVRNWGNYSDVLRESDADPTHISARSSDLSLPPGNMLVSNAFQVVQILGIILSPCYAPSRFPRTILDYNEDDEYCFPGRPLVEVFSVRIDNIDNEDPGQLYGTIVVNDGLTQIIYNRPRSYAESIRAGQNVTIIGPHQSIWAKRSFTIHFLLTDSDSWSPDDEVINDNISWDAFDFRNASMYDKPTSQQVKGKYGSATVNYAVLRNASTALVTISLEEGGEDTVQVYGNVAASYSYWNDHDDDDYPNATSVLFNRPSDDYLQVRRWQNIPLLKSIVAVPLGSSLKITANLYDYDSISADDKVAIGTVEFPAHVSGQSSKDITGEDGNKVTVTVSWGEAIAPDGDRGYTRRAPHDEL